MSLIKSLRRLTTLSRINLTPRVSLAIMLTIIAQYLLRLDTWLIVAAVLLVFAVVLLPPLSYGAVNENLQSTTPARWAQGLLLVGGALCFVATYHLASSWTDAFDVWAPLLLFGITLVVLSSDRALGVIATLPRVTCAEWLIVVALVIVALLFRSYRLTEFPPVDGFTAIEEAQFGAFATDVLRGKSRPWQWLQSTYSAALGIALWGNSVLSMRIVSVIIGALSIPPFYLLARELYGRLPAFVSTSLFASCFWHAVVSRFHHNTYHGLPLLLCALYVLVRFLRQPTPARAALLAVFAGIELYDYDVYKATTVIICATFGLWSLRRGLPLLLGTPNRPSLSFSKSPPYLVGSSLLIFGTLFAALAVPLTVKAIDDPVFFFSGPTRMYYGIGNGYYSLEDPSRFIWLRIERILDLSKLLTGISHQAAFVRMNLPQNPFLEPVTGTLFMLGLGLTVKQARSSENILLLCVFFLFLLGGGLLHDHLDVQRLLPVAPLAHLFAACALKGLIDPLRPTSSPSRPLPLRVLAAIICAGAIALGVALNFQQLEKILGNSRLKRETKNHYTLLLDMMRELPPGSFSVILTRYASNFFMRNDYSWSIAPNRDGVIAVDFLEIPAALARCKSHSACYLAIQEPYDLEAYSTWLGANVSSVSCKSRSKSPIDDGYSLLRCEVHDVEGAIAEISNESGRRLRATLQWDASEGATDIRRYPFLDYSITPRQLTRTSAVACHDDFVAAEFEGDFEVDQAGRFVFALRSMTERPLLFIDGSPVSENSPVELSKGAHTARLSTRWACDRENGIALLWRAVEAQKFSIVPFF